jgi:hypothetical protein
MEESRRGLLYIKIPQFGEHINPTFHIRVCINGDGVPVPVGARNFSPHHRVQTGSGTHPASYPMGIRGSFFGMKRPGREADRSPPSSAEVKNAWSYASTLRIRLNGMVLS